MSRYILTDTSTGEIIDFKALRSNRFKSRKKPAMTRNQHSDRHVTFMALVIALAVCIAK